MKPNFKKTEGNKLIAIVGDEVLLPPPRTQSPASCSPESDSATFAGRQTTTSSTKVPPAPRRIHKAVSGNSLRAIPTRCQHLRGAGDPGSQRSLPARDHLPTRRDLPGDSGDPLKREALRSGERRGHAKSPPTALRLRTLRGELML